MPAPTASITIAALTDGVTAIATDQIPVNRAGADRYITPGYIETMLSASNISTGTLPAARGGTGVSNAGTITNASNTTITGGGTIALGGFTLTVPATGSAALLATANVFTVAQAITLTDSATNATTNLLIIDHESSGTPAANFGTRIVYRLQSSTTANRDAVYEDVTWSLATDASRKAQWILSCVDAGGTRECIRVAANGATSNLSFFGVAAVAKQTSGANLTNNVTSGGTTDTVDTWTDLTVYATDAAAIRNAVYQLARKLKQVNDGLRSYGLLT